MKRWLLIVAMGLIVSACGGDKSSPTAPSTPTTPTTPAPTLYTITGTVNSAAGGAITNATVRVADGPNAGLSSGTDGSGRYTLSGLQFAGFTIGVTAPGFLGASRGGILTAGNPNPTTNFTLLPETPWTQSGTGNTVFTMPSYFARVRIIGIYNQNSSNFIIRIGGRLVVNELLGTAWGTTRYDGVHLANGGGVVEITNSSGVAWSLTEQR